MKEDILNILSSVNEENHNSKYGAAIKMIQEYANSGSTKSEIQSVLKVIDKEMSMDDYQEDVFLHISNAVEGFLSDSKNVKYYFMNHSLKPINSIVELISNIRERPTMYLTRESISCLKAFIDGWFIGRQEKIVDGDVMESFQTAIEKKYKITTSHSWCDIILFYSLDEHKALKKFFEEFEEHLASIDFKSSTTASV